MYINAEKNDMLFCYYYKNRDPQAESARKFKETVEENVLAYVNFNSKCSTAEIAHQCNTSFRFLETTV